MERHERAYCCSAGGGNGPGVNMVKLGMMVTVLDIEKGNNPRDGAWHHCIALALSGSGINLLRYGKEQK